MKKDDSGRALEPAAEVLHWLGEISSAKKREKDYRKDGKEVMVDKTWVFKKGKDGKLRIIVHKSALPFDPGK